MSKRIYLNRTRNQASRAVSNIMPTDHRATTTCFVIVSRPDISPSKVSKCMGGPSAAAPWRWPLWGGRRRKASWTSPTPLRTVWRPGGRSTLLVDGCQGKGFSFYDAFGALVFSTFPATWVVRRWELRKGGSPIENSQFRNGKMKKRYFLHQLHHPIFRICFLCSVRIRFRVSVCMRVPQYLLKVVSTQPLGGWGG